MNDDDNDDDDEDDDDDDHGDNDDDERTWYTDNDDDDDNAHTLLTPFLLLSSRGRPRSSVLGSLGWGWGEGSRSHFGSRHLATAIGGIISRTHRRHHFANHGRQFSGTAIGGVMRGVMVLLFGP